MPKFLIQASYTGDGLKGLAKDKASGRKTAVAASLKAVGAKLDAFYFSFGAYDAALIVDAPDNITAASIALSVASTGLVSIQTTPLLTIDEMDKAIALPSKYRAPGA